MPIYEYMCAKCGEFETTQRITDEPLKRCPSCRSKVRKLISNTTFQLKGSGWYITDYGRKEGAGKDGAASKDGEKGKSDSSTTSESTSSDTTSSTPSTDKKAAKKSPAKKEGAKASGGAQAA